MLESVDVKFEMLGINDWLTYIPALLGVNELLDHAAIAFLDTFKLVKFGEQSDSNFLEHEVAMKALAALQEDPTQPRTLETLAAAAMMRQIQIWTSNSAQDYRIIMQCICQLLNETVEEEWEDQPLAQPLRLSLLQATCLDTVFDAELVIDGRYAHILNQQVGPYMPLDEENGQPIESLGFPFLLRLRDLLHAPESNHNDIKVAYSRLRTEWPCTRRRYQYMSSMSKLKGMDQSALRQPRAQLGISHLAVLGIALIFGAYLNAMDPTDKTLREDAIHIGNEVVQLSRDLLSQLPDGIGFPPMALFAAWVATDDPDVVFNVVLMTREYDHYWSDPNYMEQATQLKKRILQVRNEVLDRTDELSLTGIEDWDTAIGYTCSAQFLGDWNQDSYPSLTAELESRPSRNISQNLVCNVGLSTFSQTYRSDYGI
ncbi:hypothetical protein NLG97_g5464 [Lecanicillium saksenae]|uniref:Uncharacterized protein n=1 Tax=Lecanicillium saksenae TaxID=468837 RepID=A0ACC1QUA2_9HYPO|nr:hypothetical protein NLG97_g5464 [Lecanicillium saksenae]